MILQKKTVSPWTDTADFKDHYILGSVKIYSSSDTNVDEISKQSSY
jgi:hypothetical protein